MRAQSATESSEVDKYGLVAIGDVLSEYRKIDRKLRLLFALGS